MPSSDERYLAYHDREWGMPVTDDVALYEKVCLEGFQAGLSWSTILFRREALRSAFEGFDIDTVANYGPADVSRLLDDVGIIRNRRKIEAAINNARRAQELRAETGSLATFFWSHEPAPAERPERVTTDWLAAHPVTPASQRLASSLKARGWQFVGPTGMYALMQAMGLVNDHVHGCPCRAKVQRARRELIRPVS